MRVTLHEWAIASIAYNANKHRPEILTELEGAGFSKLVAEVRGHPFFKDAKFDPSDDNHYSRYQRRPQPRPPRSSSLKEALDRILNPTGDVIDWSVDEEFDAVIKIVRENPQAFDLSNPRDRDDWDRATEFLQEHPNYSLPNLWDPNRDPYNPFL